MANVIGIEFKKAERKQAKARIALCAPAGGGKTHSALLIAKGLAPNGKIAVVDTENGSAALEAGKENIPDFDTLTMHAPFDPIKYVKAIKAAEDAGYDVVILDSLTHAWAGTGGLLDKVDMISKGSKSGNSYTAWRDITPQHNALVEAILQSKCHIIGTMRTKTDYVLETNSKGGMSPKKVGMAPIQREGMDYEFTIVFDIDQASHIATATKDRTSLFDQSPFKPSVETGSQIREWLNSGTAPQEPPKAPDTTQAPPEAPKPAEDAETEDTEAPQVQPPPAEPEPDKTPVSGQHISLIQSLAKQKQGIDKLPVLIEFLEFTYDIKLPEVAGADPEKVAAGRLELMTAAQAKIVIKDLLKQKSEVQNA